MSDWIAKRKTPKKDWYNSPNMLSYLADDIGSINILYPPGTGGNFLTIQLLGKDNQKNTINDSL